MQASWVNCNLNITENVMNDDPNIPPDPNPLPETNNRIPPELILPPNLDMGLKIAIETHDNRVHIVYSKPVSVLILGPHQARQMALQMFMHAENITSPKPPKPIV